MAAYTEANLETAMCLWEAVLDMRAKAAHDPAATLIDEALDQWFEAEGTCAVRHAVIGWVEECEQAWETAREAGTELVPYDWEHCPAFLAHKLEERFPALVEG